MMPTQRSNLSNFGTKSRAHLSIHDRKDGNFFRGRFLFLDAFEGKQILNALT